MLLAEALGRDQFRDRVKIYATDVDEQALNEARQASYSEKQVEAVPRPWLEKYFVQEGERYVFDKDLRRSVIFGRHDLIQDAPISRVSLVVCRNALMYFNGEAQSRILARFHFALAEHGVDLLVVVRVVAMVRGGLKDRREIDRVHAQLGHVVELLDHADEVAALVSEVGRWRSPFIEV